MDAKETKQAMQKILDYFTEIGVSHRVDMNDLKKLFHPDYVLTYYDKVIVTGIKNLEIHFHDFFKQNGVCRVKVLYIVAEADRCVARYDFVTDSQGLVRCMALFTFKDGLCNGHHDELIESEEQVKAYNASKTFVNDQLRLKQD